MTPRWLLWPFLVLLAAIIPASAQDWPSKTVTVVVPFTPAGSTDLLVVLRRERDWSLSHRCLRQDCGR